METQNPFEPGTDKAAPAGPSNDEKLLAALAHVLPLVGAFVVGPLVIYVLKRHESRFVAFHALQAMAWQLVWCVLGTFFWYPFFGMTWFFWMGPSPLASGTW